MKYKLFALFTLSCGLVLEGASFFQTASADEFHPLFQGARALAMGGAFTAVADDEEAIFYNAAGMAGIQRLAFQPLTSDIQVSNDAISTYPVLASSLNSPSISSLNNLMGKDLYLRAQETSSVVLRGFGIAALFDEQLAIRMKNEVNPQALTGSQTTYGAQMAFGFPVVKFKRKKGELRFGIALKFLERSGGYQNVGLPQLMTLDTKAIFGNVGGSFGTGIGADSGMQLVYNVKKKFSLLSGIAFTDMGQTAFSNGAGPQLSNLTFGVAGRYKSPDLTATLSYDYAHILDYSEWQKKNHLGLELKFPALSLYAGINQVYPTYGAGIDLWIVNIMYLSYAEEQATLVNQDPERRQMIHVSVKFEL